MAIQLFQKIAQQNVETFQRMMQSINEQILLQNLGEWVTEQAIKDLIEAGFQTLQTPTAGSQPLPPQAGSMFKMLVLSYMFEEYEWMKAERIAGFQNMQGFTLEISQSILNSIKLICDSNKVELSVTTAVM